MQSLDTITFFTRCIDGLERLLRSTHFQLDERNATCLHFARLGYEEYSTEAYVARCQGNIVTRLGTDLSRENLDWFEDCADIIAITSSYILGSLMGMLSAGTIRNEEFILADAHLPGYLFEKNEELCSRLMPLFRTAQGNDSQ